MHYGVRVNLRSPRLFVLAFAGAGGRINSFAGRAKGEMSKQRCVRLWVAVVVVCLAVMSERASATVILLSSNRTTELQITRPGSSPAPTVVDRSDLASTPAMGASDGLNANGFVATTFITASSSFYPGAALFQPVTGAFTADAVQTKTTGTAANAGTPQTAHAKWQAHLQLG